MAIQPGTRLGPYEIVSSLGAGGMGEVYRARDTQLNRDVAIKVLPEAFAAHPERLARFTREAQTLAALNHPNIAHIHGLEESGGVRALVMELVEGEDLAGHIARGPVPAADVLAIARQTADALEAAHEAGIVHRDLKPANIKLRADGTIKVLDFGLAKAMDTAMGAGASGVPSSSHALVDPYESPTFTQAAMTQLGTIVGTAAYMAPEQARGKPVDKRADIWAFGVVLHEMLTGRRLFEGETVSDVLAAVLTKPIDASSWPAGTPPRLRRLIARCLERDPRRRLRDIGDARAELEEAEATEPERWTVDTRRSSWIPWAVTAFAAAVAIWALATRTIGTVGTIDGHFTLQLPDGAALVTSDLPIWSQGPIAVAPDGRQVVYVAPQGPGTQLYLRTFSDLTPRPVAGTDGARLPFFSPDGRWVAFFADGKLKKAPLSGGTPVTLAAAPDGAGGSWGANGEIVYAPAISSGLFAVSDAGGAPRRVTSLDSKAGDDVHAWPQVLPGNRFVLFTAVAWSRETSEVALVDLRDGSRRVVQRKAAYARYVSDAEGGTAGHVVFVSGNTLMAAPFQPASSSEAGTPVSVLEGVRSAQFDFSNSGVLAYAPGSATASLYSLVWVDREGRSQPINDRLRGYEDLHLSPDGRQVVLTVEESGADSPAHVWVADTERRTLTRLTFEGFSRDPVWSPDGQSVVFGSKRGDNTFGLYLQRMDGRSPAELLWQSPTAIWPDPQSWTPDGSTVVFTTKGKDTHDDIWTVSVKTREARPWLQTPSSEWAGRVSPDGRWMAYSSSESGHDEVYVQPYPGPGAKRLVSAGGGTNPIWSRDGHELFYRRGADIVAVSVETEAGFTVGAPVRLFSGRYRMSGRDFDVSPDGKRFVMMHNDDPRTIDTINVLLDWRRLLAARLSGNH